MRGRNAQALASPIALAGLLSCAGANPPKQTPDNTATASPKALVLQINEGERRVRRNAGKGPFILRVDRRNGGSPDLVMGYEDIAPGVAIDPHRHLAADEILFVHRGSGVASLDGKESPVSAGTTVFREGSARWDASADTAPAPRRWAAELWS